MKSPLSKWLLISLLSVGQPYLTSKAQFIAATSPTASPVDLSSPILGSVASRTGTDVIRLTDGRELQVSVWEDAGTTAQCHVGWRIFTPGGGSSVTSMTELTGTSSITITNTSPSRSVSFSQLRDPDVAIAKTGATGEYLVTIVGLGPSVYYEPDLPTVYVLYLLYKEDETAGNMDFHTFQGPYGMVFQGMPGYFKPAADSVSRGPRVCSSPNVDANANGDVVFAWVETETLTFTATLNIGPYNLTAETSSSVDIGNVCSVSFSADQIAESGSSDVIAASSSGGSCRMSCTIRGVYGTTPFSGVTARYQFVGQPEERYSDTWIKDNTGGILSSFLSFRGVDVCLSDRKGSGDGAEINRSVVSYVYHTVENIPFQGTRTFLTLVQHALGDNYCNRLGESYLAHWIDERKGSMDETLLPARIDHIKPAISDYGYSFSQSFPASVPRIAALPWVNGQAGSHNKNVAIVADNGAGGGCWGFGASGSGIYLYSITENALTNIPSSGNLIVPKPLHLQPAINHYELGKPVVSAASYGEQQGILVAFEAGASPGLCPDKNIVARFYTARGVPVSNQYGFVHEMTRGTQFSPSISARISSLDLHMAAGYFFVTDVPGSTNKGVKSTFSCVLPGGSVGLVENECP